MRWLLLGVAAAGGLLLLCGQKPRTSTGTFDRGFGMAMAGDASYGAQQSASYGMAFYGGFNDMQQAPRGVWTPSLLEGR